MTRLPELLDELAEQAKYYDVTERAYHGGRRRRQRRRAASATAAVAATVLIGLAIYLPIKAGRPQETVPSPPSNAASPSPIAWFPSTCAIERLPLPAGYPDMSFVNAGDRTGRYLAGSARPGNGKPSLLFWDSGKLTAIQAPGQDTEFTSVNVHGAATVYGFLNADTPASWIYRDGKLTRLPGEKASALAINEGNVIAGSSGYAESAVPVVWRTPESNPESLPLPPGPGWHGEAWAIGDDGVILGVVNNYSGGVPVRQDYVWFPNGTHRPLGTPAGFHDASIYPSTYRDGWLTGVATQDSDLALRWNIETGQVTELRGTGHPALINSQGWIVTQDSNAQLVADERHRVTLSLDLPGLADANHNEVRSISDDGRTIGGNIAVNSAGYPAAPQVAVVWRCN
jgi:hypothetical protein